MTLLLKPHHHNVLSREGCNITVSPLQPGDRLGGIAGRNPHKFGLRYEEDPGVFYRLGNALEAAALNRWVVRDMKNDGKRIFAFE